MNRRTLVLAILDTRSSYLQQIAEQAIRETPDTVQWWVGGESSWRIQTFAIDHDIHLHQIHGASVEYFVENTRKHFGDVIRQLYTLVFDDYTDPEEVRRVFEDAALRPDLELSEHGFAFWNPDQGHYKTQSRPKQ